MRTKKCSKCKLILPVASFSKDKNSSTGLRSQCKACVKKYRKRNKELDKAYKIKYRAKHRKPKQNKTGPDKEKKQQRDKEYEAKNKEKRKAKRAVRSAIDKNILHRPGVCSFCKAKCKPHAHHPDYKKPLTIIWLCARCHVMEHFRLRKEANQS